MQMESMDSLTMMIDRLVKELSMEPMTLVVKDTSSRREEVPQPHLSSTTPLFYPYHLFHVYSLVVSYLLLFITRLSMVRSRDSSLIIPCSCWC